MFAEPLVQRLARFFGRDFPICKDPGNFVEAFLLFIFRVYFFEIEISTRIAKRLNQGTRLFRHDFSIRQLLGNFVQVRVFLLLLLLFAHCGSLYSY